MEDARDRRAKLAEDMENKREVLLEKIQEKMEQHELIAHQMQENNNIHAIRLKLWLTIIVFLNKLDKMSQVVLPVRELKNKNKIQ